MKEITNEKQYKEYLSELKSLMLEAEIQRLKELV